MTPGPATGRTTRSEESTLSRGARGCGTRVQPADWAPETQSLNTLSLPLRCHSPDDHIPDPRTADLRESMNLFNKCNRWPTTFINSFTSILVPSSNIALWTQLESDLPSQIRERSGKGVHLPNLSQLKLTGSRLGSLRDLGTSLGRLQVLWLARCGLDDLDGISSFPALKELYVSYNNISDLSPLCLLDQLEVLDLEGNSLEDLEQVRYLQLCPRLATLTLEGNLVCLQPAASPADKAPGCYNYRAEVRKLIPQLRILDEVPTTCTNLPAPRELSQDWLMVKEAIKEGSMLDSVLPSLDHTHGATLHKRDPALSLPETPPWVLSLLGPAGLTEGLLPEDPAPEDHASNLTHGAGRVLCGNLTKGLWERRHQCQAQMPPEQLPLPRSGLAATPATPQPDSTTDSHDLNPMPPDSTSSSPQSSADLQVRGRRLRALGSLRPGLGEGLTSVTTLRALEGTSGPTLKPNDIQNQSQPWIQQPDPQPSAAYGI
ncbi:Leucine-rich repeat-containing protein 56 [Fukomys damarensis]|uniref:Leucine-rich repeat-containing protein 56 n=1 Tax=Fukomys damarensis TaxID=885580 RepID=A0A091D7B6_FUKDA|nr:Leucine-rich repeat-containing protein 56 [Fukomys damarensis]